MFFSFAKGCPCQLGRELIMLFFTRWIGTPVHTINAKSGSFARTSSQLVCTLSEGASPYTLTAPTSLLISVNQFFAPGVNTGLGHHSQYRRKGRSRFGIFFLISLISHKNCCAASSPLSFL